MHLEEGPTYHVPPSRMLSARCSELTVVTVRIQLSWEINQRLQLTLSSGQTTARTSVRTACCVYFLVINATFTDCGWDDHRCNHGQHRSGNELNGQRTRCYCNMNRRSESKVANRIANPYKGHFETARISLTKCSCKCEWTEEWAGMMQFAKSSPMVIGHEWEGSQQYNLLGITVAVAV